MANFKRTRNTDYPASSRKLNTEKHNPLQPDFVHRLPGHACPESLIECPDFSGPAEERGEGDDISHAPWLSHCARGLAASRWIPGAAIPRVSPSARSRHKHATSAIFASKRLLPERTPPEAQTEQPNELCHIRYIKIQVQKSCPPDAVRFFYKRIKRYIR
jgi:hypothetical protein